MKKKVIINFKDWVLESSTNIGYLLKKGNYKIIIKNFKRNNIPDNILNLSYLYSKNHIPIFNIV